MYLNNEIIYQLPKVELHCHLDGSVPLETLTKLAIKDNYPVEKLKHVSVDNTCQSLTDYLKCFTIILDLLQTTDNLYIATYETIEHIAKENVVYIELRFAPLLHRHKGLSIKEVIETVARAVDSATKQFDIHVNLLICLMRHHTDEQNQSVLKCVQSLSNKYIVGIDAAGDEVQYDNDKIGMHISVAKNSGFNITLHSGECGCPHNVLSAVKLGATRIGHGIAVVKDDSILEEVAKKNILLEMCPTSNVQTKAIQSFKDFPIQLLLSKGVKCCINTDNRTVSQTTLTDEYVAVIKHCQVNKQQVKEMLLNAINYSFATDSLKQDIKAQIIEAFLSIA